MPFLSKAQICEFALPTQKQIQYLKNCGLENFITVVVSSAGFKQILHWPAARVLGSQLPNLRTAHAQSYNGLHNDDIMIQQHYNGIGKCVVIMVFYTFSSVVMKEEEEDEGEIVEETVDILLEVTEEFVD